MSGKTFSDQKTSEREDGGNSQPKAIRGKVAKVISDQEVALNVGNTHNVEVGMIFDIIPPEHPKDFEIKDPETGEVLGNIQPKAKARVKVVSVNDKFSLAATYRLESIEHLNLRGDLLPFPAVMGKRRVESFKTREAPQESTEQRTFYVARGDAAVQVINE